MQRELVTAPEHWTVGEAIDHLRSETDLPEQFYHVILIDPRLRPVGYVTLGRLLGSRRDVKLADITEDSFRTIKVTQPDADVAYAFNQYHLISAPVVDEGGRLIGVITIDDAMAVLRRRAGEDILRLGGVGDEEHLSDRSGEIAKRRAPWLAVNLVTAVLASLVIALFEAMMAQIVALAVLMPIVASMGGNAGTQSLTVAVRGLATRDLTPTNALRVPEVDDEIQARFESLLQSAAEGELDAWSTTPRGRLALILLTDQFPRNMYRDTPGMYDYDAQARALCIDGLQRGDDRELRPIERVFFCLPLEHSENLDHQAWCVDLMRTLAREAPAEWQGTFEEFVDYAEAHCRIIDRFGRFPHRNAILGRRSSAEEREFLKQPGSSF
jgi:uncharacterized protein (DUF924 family)